MNRTTLTLSLSLVLLPMAAFAQASAPPLRDREAVTYPEIERGVYFGVTVGPYFLLNPPKTGGPSPFSPGQMAQLEFGVDIGEHVSLALFGMASANHAPSDYIGYSGGAASGDFSAIAGGLTAKLNIIGFDDANEVRRTWLYIRAGGAYSSFAPRALLPNSDFLVFAGPGVEYFTRLRHFSIGLEVTGELLARTSTWGFAVAPNLRYAF